MARGADRGNNTNFQQRQDGSAANNQNPMMNSGGLSIGKQSSQQNQPNDFNNISARNSVTPFTTSQQ